MWVKLQVFVLVRTQVLEMANFVAGSGHNMLSVPMVRGGDISSSSPAGLQVDEGGHAHA